MRPAEKGFFVVLTGVAMHHLLAALVLTAAPAPSPAPAAAPPPAKAAQAMTVPDLAGMDRGVAPGDDFFAYANGAWEKTTEIPADRAAFGVWDILLDAARQHTIELIQDAAKSGAEGDAKRIGDYYTSYMDEAGLEAKGAKPLEPGLAAIAAIKDKKQLAAALGATVRADVDALNSTNFHTLNILGVWVVQALDDPKTYTPYLLQGGIGMPDREYYVSAKPEMVELRKKYEATLTQLFTLAGQTEPAARAARVMALETKLAGVHATREESGEVKQVEPWKREVFAKKAPGLDWAAFFQGASLASVPRFYLWQPKAVVGIAGLVGKESLESWKDLLAAHHLLSHAPFLSAAFVQANFDFYGKALAGTPEMRPRWKRGVDSTGGALGEAVGKLYVAKYFSPDAKAKAQAMVDAVVKAFGARVDALAWMSPKTKAKAKEKVATLRVGVGYPDHWRDYEGLVIAKDDLFGNVDRVRLFDYQHELAKLKQPVDRDEWWMTPQTVNAVNLPLQNALNFPAAILQPPFFDPAGDPAANFGAIGAVIGHEISHSFDNDGAQFDAQGRFLNWWTPEDLKHFTAAGEALAKQYDAYEPLPGLHLNGKQVLGENIADVAGLAAAYDAWKATAGEGAAAKVGPGGLTGAQLFFVGFAQAWRSKEREQALRAQVVTDGHAPARYRAQTVRNLDPWYTAFDIKPDQKLALPADKRVRVW